MKDNSLQLKSLKLLRSMIDKEIELMENDSSYLQTHLIEWYDRSTLIDIFKDIVFDMDLEFKENEALDCVRELSIKNFYNDIPLDYESIHDFIYNYIEELNE